MKTLIQIVYISRSTFMPVDATNGIEPNVARILMKSRTNNKSKGLVGVLYFGNGCFFQCLEGEESTVASLYATLLKDSRHKDLKVLSRKAIKNLSFSDWAMKYVPLEAEMTKLLQSRGFDKFNPYAFDSEMTRSVLALLHATNDVETTNKTELIVEQPQKTVNTNNQKIAQYALILSIFSMVLSIFTLLSK